RALRPPRLPAPRHAAHPAVRLTPAGRRPSGGFPAVRGGSEIAPAPRSRPGARPARRLARALGRHAPQRAVRAATPGRRRNFGSTPCRLQCPPFHGSTARRSTMGLLDGKVAIVTGAGGGIGREHALALAEAGAAVVVNDLGGARDGTGASHSMADAVVEEIRKAGGTAVASYDNVATVEGGRAILKTALDAFHQVDILVNNAGILRDRTLAKMEEPEWDAVIAVHLKGTYCVTRPVFNHMRE